LIAMRPVRVLAGASSDTADRPWFPGLPHAMAGIATYFVFGAPACVTGLLLATLAGFVVYLPVTALALNGGRAYAAGEPAPALSRRTQLLLLGLWTLTAWLGAALAAAAG
jgi:hypothetical protein